MIWRAALGALALLAPACATSTASSRPDSSAAEDAAHPIPGEPGYIDPGFDLGLHPGPVALEWPLVGRLVARFGHHDGRHHDGIDIHAPEGTEVGASAPGVVLYSGARGAGYGNLVLLRHAGGLKTLYAHNQLNLVKEGARVSAGQPIARVGATGDAAAPALHFEVRQGDTPVNPLHHLGPVPRER